MLQVLKQTPIEQLWVTTRTHLREELEDKLQQLSHTLQPFSEVEQFEFIKKFWLKNSNIEVMNQQRLKIYAQALIRKLAQSISDRDRQFTGIPLQTRMLAEAFEEEFRSFYVSEKSKPELPHKLDLLALYKRFIERKYDIYYEEKSKFQQGNVGVNEIRKIHSDTIKLQHQLLALEALFTVDQVTFLQSYNNATLSNEELARIGIAQRNSEGRPHFIHRTFAEFYAAEFLIKRFTMETKQHEQVQMFLLNVVLLGTECKVIRAFLDGLLTTSKPTKEILRQYGETLNGMWHKKKVKATLIVDKTQLHEAAEEDNVGIIEFLLNSLNTGESISAVKELLLAKDNQGQTAWHKAAEEGHVEVLNKLWVWAKELQLEPEELRNEVLLLRDMYDNTAWYKAAEKGHVEVLNKLCDWAKDLQLKPEELKNEVLLSKYKYNETAWHKAAESGNVEVLQKLCDWAKELKLKPEEIRNKVFFVKI
jgi:hypothetical protein